jgi:hypothetical protein
LGPSHGDSGYSDADDVTGDAVLEQVETEFDANSNPIKTTLRRRFHDEVDIGPLGTPTMSMNARVARDPHLPTGPARPDRRQ